MAIKFLNTATAATQAVGDNSTKIATTAYADAAAAAIPIGDYLPLSAGSSYPLTGGLYVPSYIYHVGDTNTLFGFGGQDLFIINTGGGRRLTVTNTEATFENNLIVDGNVGIGTSSPDFKLDVAGSIRIEGDGALLFGDTSTSPTWGIGVVGNDLAIDSTISGDVTFINAGNVGIGTTSPDFKLDVAGDVRIENDFGLYFGDTGTSPKWGMASSGLDFIINNSTTNGDVVFLNDGNVGVGVSSPGAKLEVNGVIKSISIGAAHLILNGDTNNAGDAGDVDAIIDLLADGNPGIYGYRINTENWAGATALNFQEYLNGTYTSRLFISKTGNVGIGTTSPNQKLHVNGATQLGDINATVNFGTVALKVVEGTISTGPTLGSGTVGAQAVLYSNGDFGMYTGVSNNGDTWMQSQRNDTGTSTYDILLNPAGGNIGIGTITPYGKLDVAGDIRLQSDNKIYFGATGSIPYWTAGVDNTTNNNFQIGGNSYYSGDRDILLTPSGSGNVGIGTTSPGYKLEVSGNSRFTDTLNVNASALGAYIQSSQSTGLRVRGGGNAQDIAQFQNVGGSTVAVIDANGNVGIGDTNPSAKLSVNGGVQVANDTATASAANVGTIRYRVSGNNSYVDMCMQTGAATYAWVNIVQNNW